jgi:acyl-CoA reductase-like NAD-dependent aldehyde dehydrogenase
MRKPLAASAASNLKRVTPEVGGKSPAVISEDADIGAAVEAVYLAILGLTGQACVLIARVLVQEGIVDQVVQVVRGYLEAVKGVMGDPSSIRGEEFCGTAG